MMYMNKKLLICLTFTSLLLPSLPSQAGEKIVDILPPVTVDASAHNLESTHPDLRLTPDKSELIHLDSEAGSIIIGNPLHINVIADSATTLVIVPRAIGATHFTVLDKNGQILMQRHVIVASPKDKYIRIRRACANGDQDCQETSVLYCPDMCHEIKDASGTEESSSQNETSATNNDKSNSSIPYDGEE